jgi:SpoVK/Ycf46/Vps4 family AAA+-type ATPase
MTLDSSCDLNQIAAQLPRNFTGADFGALTSEAYMIAVKKRIEEV